MSKLSTRPGFTNPTIQATDEFWINVDNLDTTFTSQKITGLQLASLLGGSPLVENVVFIDQNTPTTVGVVFDPNTPATEDTLYISSTNGSAWIWNGTAYVTYSVPSTSSTEWYLAGTTIDAGGNKTAYISRTGGVRTFGNLFLGSNATYLQGVNSAGLQTRLIGISALNVMYIGSIDANVSSINFAINTVDLLSVDNTGLITTKNYTLPLTAPTAGQVLGYSSAGVSDWVANQDLSTYQPYTTATTGSVISFAIPQIYNSVASPSSSNITDSLTGAKIGVVQKIYHNHTVAPTFPAGWVKMGTATYTTSTLNVIFAEWVSSTRVEYWITKPS